ncbi:hypothetical protein [Streptomyces sp. MST-110588]|uniref:hypothetical protein n=1 Tax=Streptomyces sp. MST-110588 TaxID=2833628 RepID=UPI001F5E00D2|nr:hypothetical protein [Streptomyces sp. MST-110588]UNO39191.1 hypothetical protein KGS77_05540 [Streptomyces sp. MST-110588]
MSHGFQRIPLIGTGDAAGTHGTPAADAAAWTLSPPVRALIEAFAEDGRDRALLNDLDAGAGSTAERLARLDRFSERWDTRQGRERNQAGQLDLTPAQRALVHAAAKALGMCDDPGPRLRHYDHVLILGGSIRGCLARPAHAAHLIRSRRVLAGHITALGGHRPFVGDESALAAAAGVPWLTEEFAALDHGTRRAFALGEPESTEGETSPLPGGAWSVRRYRAAGIPPVHVVAAPSSAPAERRADTADTYAFFSERLAGLRPGTRLLLVTASINVPAQHVAALRMLALPHGAVVDTVGNLPRSVPPALARRFTATEYLLEVRSTIRALYRLVLAGQPA